jgi:hypothetical protein
MHSRISDIVTLVPVFMVLEDGLWPLHLRNIVISSGQSIIPLI